MQKALSLIGEDLKNVELQFKKDLQSEVPLIRKVGEYILASGGKRIRPALLLLSARLAGYSGDRQIPLASVIEFIHTATLLHDDVVDSATLRRGLASANTLWGNSASVLIGDFLFSKSFSIMVEDGDLNILRVLSSATTKIAEGEVLQLICTSDLDTTEERYIEVVKRKTAILLAAACQAGAILGGVPPEREQALSDYGMDLGIAFQLIDDLLDYTADEAEFGKSIGHDLEEGKITLPLIHTITNCTAVERELIGEVVAKTELTNEDFATVFKLVGKYDGLGYTIAAAERHIAACKKHLAPFESSPTKEAMIELAEYVLSRTK
jgi:octaprenyl-diphosphate synthase